MNIIKLPVQTYPKRLCGPRLDVFYPVIAGGPNPSAEGMINYTIYNTVQKLLWEQGYFQNPLANVTGGFEIKNNQRDILSLSVINYTFAGGAHGMTIIKSLTADISTGRFYKLADLFKPGSNYVEVLSNIIKAQIAARDIMLLGEFTRIRPNQDFYIADKSLVIYFQLYEITPYAYGFPYFPISVYELTDIINEKGPLARML
ncbi:MAG: DUF3298 domain-containing protein [Peptococcaceae bacterium]